MFFLRCNPDPFRRPNCLFVLRKSAFHGATIIGYNSKIKVQVICCCTFCYPIYILVKLHLEDIFENVTNVYTIAKEVEVSAQQLQIPDSIHTNFLVWKNGS